ALGQPRLRRLRLAFGRTLLGPRLLELALDQGERVLRVVVLLRGALEPVLEARELVLRGLDLLLGGRREAREREGGEDHGEDEDHGNDEPCDLPPRPGHELLGPTTTKAPFPRPSPGGARAWGGGQPSGVASGRNARGGPILGPPLSYRCRDGGI